MSILIPTPADHNHTTEVFKRTLASASFLCNAAESVAVHKTKKGKGIGVWLYRAALALVAGAALVALTGCSKEQPEEDTYESKALVQMAEVKRAAAGAWACPGMHAEWTSETEVMCLKEKR